MPEQQLTIQPASTIPPEAGALAEVVETLSLRHAIHRIHGCHSNFIKWENVATRVRRGDLVLRRVGIFEVFGIPPVTLAYAWFEPGNLALVRLQVAPVYNARMAILVTVADQARTEYERSLVRPVLLEGGLHSSP